MARACARASNFSELKIRDEGQLLLETRWPGRRIVIPVVIRLQLAKLYPLPYLFLPKLTSNFPFPSSKLTTYSPFGPSPKQECFFLFQNTMLLSVSSQRFEWYHSRELSINIARDMFRKVFLSNSVVVRVHLCELGM